MKAKDFEEIFEQQVQISRDMLLGKADEYATDDDRLHNFKVAADIRGCSNIQAVSGMMVKHTVSVYDMCESDKSFDIERWTEKITDSINYLILLKASVIEDIWNTPGVFPYFEMKPSTIPCTNI